MAKLLKDNGGSLPVRNCALSGCGKAFVPVRKWQRYCMPRHRQRGYQDRLVERLVGERLKELNNGGKEG